MVVDQWQVMTGCTASDPMFVRRTLVRIFACGMLICSPAAACLAQSAATTNAETLLANPCSTSANSSGQPSGRLGQLSTPMTDTTASRNRTSALGESIPAANKTIVLIASASAAEVTFAKEPKLSVSLCGGLDSVKVVERRNLPSTVVAGTTYRDVHVAVEIFGKVNAECLGRMLGDTTTPKNVVSIPGKADCAAVTVGGMSGSGAGQRK